MKKKSGGCGGAATPKMPQCRETMETKKKNAGCGGCDGGTVEMPKCSKNMKTKKKNAGWGSSTKMPKR